LASSAAVEISRQKSSASLIKSKVRYRNLVENSRDMIILCDRDGNIGYSNPAVDALLEAGRREFAREKRAPIYAEIDRRIHADDPITILLYQPSLWCFSKSLRGFRPSPKGFYGYLPGFHALWRKKEAKP